MGTKKTIGAVNVLDLRRATPETLATIGRIENTNVVVTSPEAAEILRDITLKNVNTTVPVPSDAEVQLTMGPITLAARTFEEQTKPTYFVAMGPVLVEPGVPAGEIEAKVAGIVSMGPLVCPETLAGVLQSKASRVMGPVLSYPSEAMLIHKGLELDDAFLSSLDDGSVLFVFGSLRAVNPLSADQLKRKVKSLTVQGSVLVAEENQSVLQAILSGASRRITVVPTGFRHRSGSLTLDAPTLASLDREKVFATGNVIVDAAVTPEDFAHGISGLNAMGIILCPESLQKALASVCDLLENRVVFYRGELWVFDSDQVLRAPRFDYLEGKATMVVTGELTLEPELAPKTLADRFETVHNFGKILCSPDQMGALEARMGIDEGELAVPDEEKETPTEYDMGYTNMLSL